MGKSAPNGKASGGGLDHALPPAPSPTPAAGRVGEQHLLHHSISRTFLEETEVGLMWVMNSRVP